MLRIIDLKELTDSEVNDIKTVASAHLKKINERINDPLIILHVKKHDITGNVKKYSIHSRLESNDVFLVAKAADWDLKKVVHQTLERLTKRVDSKFKRDKDMKKHYPKRFSEK